jgi:hypothetical protein
VGISFDDFFAIYIKKQKDFNFLLCSGKRRKGKVKHPTSSPEKIKNI